MQPELFKEKEETEIVQKSLDPENGLIIEDDSIDLSVLYKAKGKTLKLKAYKEAHQNKEKQSDLKEMDENFKHASDNSLDSLEINEIPEVMDDFADMIVSIDELIDHLDNSEEYIDEL